MQASWTGRVWAGAAIAGLLGIILAGSASAADTVSVGVLVTRSPPGSVIQGTQVLDGLHIAQKIINSKGGVLGKQIKLVVEDTSGLPERGRSGAEKLITQNKVVAITGEHQSSVCLAELPVIHKYHIPFVNTNCWSDAVRKKGYPEVFNVSPWNSLVSRAMAEVIQKMGVKKVVAFAENTDYGIGQAKILQAKLKSLAPDVSYTYHVLDRTASEFTPTLLPLRHNPPDMVVTIMLPPAGYLLMSQLYAQGIAPSDQTWLFDGAGISDYPDFWDNVSDAGKYLIALGFYHPKMQLTDLGKQVRDAYVKKTGKAPGRLIFQAADSLFVIADAIRRADSTDPSALLKALKQTHYDGTRGTITFSDKSGPTFHQWINIPYVVYQYTGVRQKIEDTTLITGPGKPLDVKLLKQP